LDKLVVKLAQQDMSVQANIYPLFSAKKVIILCWEMENAHSAWLAHPVVLQYLPHSSVPLAIIQDQGQPIAVFAHWVSNVYIQIKIQCLVLKGNMHLKVLMLALTVHLAPSVQALRYPLLIPAQVVTLHQP
jgi:hypothetical protein